MELGRSGQTEGRLVGFFWEGFNKEEDKRSQRYKYKKHRGGSMRATILP